MTFLSTELWNPTRDLFNDFFEKDAPTTFLPAYEAGETDESFWLAIDMPGVAKENIKIEVVDGKLVVTGERKKESDAEQRHGSFYRAFSLGKEVNADKIEANHRDGVLRIKVAKAEAAKPRTIQVN